MDDPPSDASASDPPPAVPSFTGAVLAGGRSSRMGRDKALIDLGDRVLMEVAVEALDDAGAAEILVVGGDAMGISARGHRWIPDRYPGQGPLGGIITALEHASHDVVAVLACDHVAADHRAVTALVEGLAGADVALPIIEGRAQTLHAIWRRGALDHLIGRFEGGARSVFDGIAGLEVARLEDLDPTWFADADTPDDLPQRPSDGEPATFEPVTSDHSQERAT